LSFLRQNTIDWCWGAVRVGFTSGLREPAESSLSRVLQTRMLELKLHRAELVQRAASQFRLASFQATSSPGPELELCIGFACVKQRVSATSAAKKMTSKRYWGNPVKQCCYEALHSGLPLKGESCVQLNLAGSADSGKYPAGVISKIARRILENGVAVPAQSERALCVRRDAKIRMVQEIERFCSKHDLHLSG
jgi:hypothetical protein